MKEKKNNNKNLKKSLKIISSVIFVLIFLFVLLTFGALVIQKVTGKPSKILVYHFYYIVTDSMSGDFEFNDKTINLEEGDVILSRSVNDKNLKDLVVPGSVITYKVNSGSLKGLLLTHRVERGIYFDEVLNTYCVLTRGTKAGAPVDEPVPVGNIKGVMLGRLSLLGKLYGFLNTKIGFLCLIILPIALLLVFQIYKFVVNINKKEILLKTKEEQEKELREEALKELFILYPHLKDKLPEDKTKIIDTEKEKED